MIDLHCHVLPGIDDGPATREGAVALARAAALSGASVLVATPHVNGRYHSAPEAIARSVDELNSHLGDVGVPVEVRPGAEISLTRAMEMEPAELERFGLGGGPWLLVEPPFTPGAAGLEILLGELQRRGHRIVLAHPERCPAFQRDPQMLRSLVSAGALTSLTAGSLVGRFGRDVRRFALSLVREGIVHNVASDAHDCGARAPGIASELERAGIGPLADWLTRAVPTAILRAAEIPPRPAVALPRRSGPRWRWSRDRLRRAS